MKGILITPTKEIAVRDFESPLYETVGAAVGGYIEHVNPRGLEPPYCMIVNEEGLLKGLPINEVGSFFYQTHLHGCPIVGTMVIMQDGFVNGEPDIVGLPDDKVNALYEKLVTMFNLKGAIT